LARSRRKRGRAGFGLDVEGDDVTIATLGVRRMVIVVYRMTACSFGSSMT
jgi:hypothetical protein